MQSDFLARGYPRELVLDAAQKVRAREQDELLRTHEKGGDTFKGITAAIDFTALAPDIKCIIHRHWHIK